MTAFDNSIIRNTPIWVPFAHYGFYNAVQEAERAVIFGLYSNSYRNNDAYMQGISDIALSQMLADFNTKMAELTTDQQKTVMDITTKRYVTSVETLIHDEKMVTELQKNNASADEWDAKIAALSVDRAALVTLQTHIATEIKRINAKITEIMAYIQLEVANLAMVDVEIAEKQMTLSEKDIQLAEKAIEEAKRDLAILQTANEIARVQLQIVNAGLELVDIDMKVARTRTDIAQTDNQIAKLGLMSSELEVAKARTTAEQEDLLTYDSKILLAEAQTTGVNKEIAGAKTHTTLETAVGQARLDESDAYLSDHLQSITLNAEKVIYGIQDRDVSAGLEKTIVEKTNVMQATTDQDKIRMNEVHVDAALKRAQAAIEAATTMASANLSSELTHLIKKKA